MVPPSRSALATLRLATAATLAALAAAAAAELVPPGPLEDCLLQRRLPCQAEVGRDPGVEPTPASAYIARIVASSG